MGQCVSYTKLIILPQATCAQATCAQIFRKRPAALHGPHLHLSSFKEFPKHLYLRITRLLKGSLIHPKSGAVPFQLNVLFHSAALEVFLTPIRFCKQ